MFLLTLVVLSIIYLNPERRRNPRGRVQRRGKEELDDRVLGGALAQGLSGFEGLRPQGDLKLFTFLFLFSFLNITLAIIIRTGYALRPPAILLINTDGK